MFPFEAVALLLNARGAFRGRSLFNESLPWPVLCQSRRPNFLLSQLRFHVMSQVKSWKIIRLTVVLFDEHQ